MLKIELTDVYGWQAAIRGMRNPKNSWSRSDSFAYGGNFHVGEADHKLMMSLAKAGTEHAKYLRMIYVSADFTGPLYWWKEMDTYKIGTVANSCSTMHKLAERDLAIEDFSVEHLTTLSRRCLQQCITAMNDARAQFKATGDKESWWQMIQLLPTSYNQKRTVELNYAVLAGIYRQRKGHKLDEWHTFCEWVEGLPYSELITGERK